MGLQKIILLLMVSWVVVDSHYHGRDRGGHGRGRDRHDGRNGGGHHGHGRRNRCKHILFDEIWIGDDSSADEITKCKAALENIMNCGTENNIVIPTNLNGACDKLISTTTTTTTTSTSSSTARDVEVFIPVDERIGGRTLFQSLQSLAKEGTNSGDDEGVQRGKRSYHEHNWRLGARQRGSHGFDFMKHLRPRHRGQPKWSKQIFKYLFKSLNETDANVMATCLLQKNNFIGSDGQIDTARIETIITSSFENYPEAKETLLANLGTCQFTSGSNVRVYLECLIEGCKLK